MNLIDLGYRDELAYDGDETYLARVIREHKGHYTIQSTEATYQAVVRGRLHHEAQSRLELPAVGDWVEITPQAHGQAMIERLIPRFSAITRKVAGLKTEAQIIAANVTKVFIVISSAEPLNKRKLERYLSVVWDSGASPIVVLSKADLSEAAEEIKQEVIDLAHGSPVELWSAETEVGKAGLFELIHPADTIVLMGSSGVGKSTLLNALFAEEKEKTGAIREHDQRGRHTTTHRELHVLPTGGIVIDTPGMREMQLWSSDNSGEDASFSDIVSLQQQCRFSDCSHTSEPGCAVSQALADQTLEQGRWNNYLKLQREKAYAKRKQSARLASEQKKQWKKQTANRKRHK